MTISEHVRFNDHYSLSLTKPGHFVRAFFLSFHVEFNRTIRCTFMRSLLARLLFTDVAPLVRLGRRRPLEANDMPPLDPDLNPLNGEERYTHLSTARPLRFVWDAYWAAGPVAKHALLINLARTPIALSGPLLMRSLLAHIALLPGHPELVMRSIGLAVLLSLSVVTEAIMVQHFFYNALKCWSRVANGLNMRVFRHALGITREAQQRTQSGDLVNHMASDSEGMAEASFFIPEILESIFIVGASLALLYTIIGAAAFAAVGTLVVMLPVTQVAARRFAAYDKELWKVRDDRVTLMSQILAGIRIVKYFAWERSMSAEVDVLRAQEINAYVKLVKAESLGVMLFLSTTTLVAFVGFSTFVMLGGTLSPAIIFPCVLLFMQMEGPIGALPHFIKNLSHATVAAQRLHSFFQLERHEAPIEQGEQAGPVPSIEIRDLCVDYRQDSRTENNTPDPSSIVKSTDEAQKGTGQPNGEKLRALDSVSLHIEAGQSVALVGAVGAGKSSLLMSILGETDATEGSCTFRGLNSQASPRVSYVSQEAYILNTTLRDNILFGHERDDSLVARAVNAAVLDEDIAQLSAGLETEIGERGVNLSGGQKMRVNLARAVAHQPNVVILDDPLAAVDVHTEELLVDRLICGEWRDLTRVVSTHRLSHLHRFDRVVFLESGRILVDAPLEQALQNCAPFREFYAEHTSADAVAKDVILATTQKKTAVSSQHDGSLVDDEDRATGSIKAELFLSYLQELGRAQGRTPWKVYTALSLSCALVVVLPMVQSAWLAWWSDTARSGVFRVEGLHNPLVAVVIYGLLGLGVLLANFGERLIWMMRATMAGRDIHNQSLASVLAAPLRFFDTTPMGRILNRFAHDMAGVDDELSWNFESFFRSFAQMVGTLILIVAAAPLVLVAAIPALMVFYRIQNDYRRSAREAKRLASISRSPRYAHFKETIGGLAQIRAYGQQQAFTDRFVEKLSFFQRMNWSSILLNRWFSTRAPLLSGVIALATTTTVVIMCSNGYLGAGIAGVVITYSLMFWTNLNWAVRSFSEVESRMTSYERLRAYGSLKPEAVVQSEPALADSAAWPQGGSIEFKHLSARYAEHLPYVLRDLNLRIEAGMRVGIVGRTGSGKTTIFQTLFRFVAAAEGSIEIDGVDIARIPTSRLRRAMAVIPQDPMLFIGTVRSNIDRFGEYSDEDVWSALTRVQMQTAIRDLGGLEAAVSESGQNFSQGQRQLLCLARAILTNAGIIVMDEATASVDVQTDALIQHTIREEFKGVTVLIIAHRLNSVADADMIIEMHHGEARLHRTASEVSEEEFE